MKIAIQTLGCKVNQSESASIEGALLSNNYEIVSLKDNPDVCIINTCTVTGKSDIQSRQVIRRAIKSGAKVIATGCYAQLRSDEISKLEGLDLIIGNSGKGDIVQYIQDMGNDKGKPKNDVASPTVSLKMQPYFSSRSRAFLKLQDGCNFSCSYCTVPRARGRSRSLEEEAVLKSVEELNRDGYKEIVLTGIHIGSYGLDLKPGSSLLRIVEKITESYPQVRIRLSSLEPREFDKKFLDLMKERNVCPHLHIPLQSGSDRVLKAMNRGYGADFFKQLIHNIITSYPDISIGTDIITGFPGESDKDFNETVKLINELPLSYLHVFPYSKRPDTKASLLSDHVSATIKKERVNTLIDLGKAKKKTYISRHIGHMLDVIVEKKSPIKGYYKAISNNYLRLFVNTDNAIAGERMKVRVISLTDEELIAEPLK
jgi:threonylcarbamoyladenosine tRNA methylthiotransferase MtaB